MKFRKNNGLNAMTELLEKVARDPASVSQDEIKQIKRLNAKDGSLIVKALRDMMKRRGEDVPLSSAAAASDEERSGDEIIADNYITLARFAIARSGLKNVSGLKAENTAEGLKIYALTPAPVELDIEQFCTSDYPANRELLREAEALSADLFMDDGIEELRPEIIRRIGAAIV